MFDLGRASGIITINVDQALGAYSKVRAAHAESMATMGQVTKSARTVGVGLLGIGAAALYAFGKAVSETARFQKQLSYFGAITGANKKQMDEVASAALKIDKVTGVGIQNVAAAFVELGKSGVRPEQIVAGMGQATVDLARAADISASQAADTLVNIKNTFHIAAKDAVGIANVLAGAANASTIDIEDLATSLKFAGASAANLNIPFKQTAAALAYLGNQGIRGSTAGTSLRMVLVSLAGRTGPATAELQKLGIILKDGSNRFFDAAGNAKSMAQIAQVLQNRTKNLSAVQREMAFNQIFGNRAMSAAILLARGGAKGIEAMNRAISAVTAQQVMEKRMDNLSGAIQRFKVALQIAAIETGSPFQKPLQMLVQFLTSVINTFNSLPGSVKEGIAILTLLVGILGTLGGAFILVVSYMGKLYAAFKSVGEVWAFIKGLQALKVAEEGAAAAAGAEGLMGTLGPLGIALGAVAVIGLGFWVASRRAAQEARKAVDDYVDSLKISYTNSASVVKGEQAITKAMQARADALRKQRPYQSFANRGTEFSQDPIKDLQAAQQKFIESDTTYKELAKSLANVKTTAAQTTSNISTLGDMFGMNRQAVINLASANNIDLTKSLGSVVTQFSAAAQAAQLSHHPLAQARADAANIGSAASSASDDINSLTNAFDTLVGATLSADDAHIEFKNDIVALDKALKKSGGRMDLNNQKARDARSAFNAAAKQAGTWAEQEAQLPGGLKRATRALKTEIDVLKAHSDGTAHAQHIIHELENTLHSLPSVAKQAGDGVKKQQHDITESGKTMAGSVKKALGDAKPGAYHAGIEFDQGYAQGINDGKVPVVTAAARIAAEAVAAARSRKGQHSGSPSRKMKQVGYEWMSGYELGILLRRRHITKAAADTAAAAVLAAKQVMAGIAAAVAPEVTDPNILRQNLKQDYLRAVSLRTTSNALDKNTEHAKENLADLTNVHRKHAQHIFEHAKNADNLQKAVAYLNKQKINNTTIDAAKRYAKHLSNLAAAAHAAAEQMKSGPAKSKAEKRAQALSHEARLASQAVDKLTRKYDLDEKHAQKAYERAKKLSDAADQAAQNAASKAQDAAKSLIDSMQSSVDQMTSMISDFQSSLAEGIRGDNTLSSVWDQLTSEGTASIGNLQTHLDEVQAQIVDFGKDLTALSNMGATPELIQQIAQMGPAAGDALAKQLIAAGKPAVVKLGGTLASIDKYTNQVATKITNTFYGAGVKAMEAFIRGLIKQFPALAKALKPLLKQLEASLSAPVTPTPSSLVPKSVVSSTSGGTTAAKTSTTTTATKTTTQTPTWMGGSNVNIYFGPTYNPKPETTSTTTARRMRTLASLGPWGMKPW